MNPKTLFSAIGSAKSVKLGLASNPESSSAWVKTLVDPAHAREYGCRGIPDENQQPTLVLCGRQTYTINLNSFYTSDNRVMYWDSSQQKWLPKATSAILSNLRLETVFIIQGEILQHTYLLASGFGDLSGVGTGEYLLIYRPLGALVSLQARNARLIAQSYTVEWIGKEIDKSGYIEAGYTYAEKGVNYPTVNLDNLGELVSYTSDSDKGVYITSMFNNYDEYRWWKATTARTPTFYFNGGEAQTVSYSDYNDPLSRGAMRKAFVTYRALVDGEGNLDTTWVFRLTVNQVVEKFASYSEGGSDAALYDKASVEDMINLYDSMDLIFPASYNDFKKVWSWIKQNAPKAVGFAGSVMRHFPQTAGIGAALNALVGESGSTNASRFVDFLNEPANPEFLALVDRVTKAVKKQSQPVKKAPGKKRRS